MKFLTELLVAATFFTTTSGFSLSNVHATSTGSSASSKVNTKYKSLMYSIPSLQIGSRESTHYSYLSLHSYRTKTKNGNDKFIHIL